MSSAAAWRARTGTWEGLVLGALQVHPLLPALGRHRQVIRQAGVLINLLHACAQLIPIGLRRVEVSDVFSH